VANSIPVVSGERRSGAAHMLVNGRASGIFISSVFVLTQSYWLQYIFALLIDLKPRKNGGGMDQVPPSLTSWTGLCPAC
jgi:hypothetical protein